VPCNLHYLRHRVREHLVAQVGVDYFLEEFSTETKSFLTNSIDNGVHLDMLHKKT
jgi:hypothetical protein